MQLKCSQVLLFGKRFTIWRDVLISPRETSELVIVRWPFESLKWPIILWGIAERHHFYSLLWETLCGFFWQLKSDVHILLFPQKWQAVRIAKNWKQAISQLSNTSDKLGIKFWTLCEVGSIDVMSSYLAKFAQALRISQTPNEALTSMLINIAH